jgi:glycerophosphoryl diester phosphodiesterase
VYGWSEIWVQLQTLADGQSWAYAAAIVNLTVLLTGRLLLLAAAVSLLALGVLAVGAEAVPVHAKSNRVHQAFWVVMALGVAAIAGFSAAYLPGARTQRPLLIAHRGLDGTNGVQNTLPALRRTMSEHPDYVELDVHETRDGQFVVLHDEDLRKLAGKSKTPRQLTLAQLRGVTVREDGQHAHLASLDQYLRVAFARKQKVIVELKTTPQDSQDAVQRFIRRYAGTLVAHDSRIHSTDLGALEQVHQSAPKLYTSLVLSYALVTPHASTKAYTFAATTIDDQLVAAVHDQHQAVWAWTVNDEVGMQQMLFAGVDGIITDNLQLLQKVVRAHNAHPAYAARMRFLCNTLSDFRYVNRVE